MAATAMLRAPLAACLLTILATACVAQTLTSKIYKSPHGESVQFHGDTVSFKYIPGASANCSQCYLAFKLGAIAELDAFGQPLAAHTIPDLSTLVPEVIGGERVSGSVTYQYISMTFTADKLPTSLNKNFCPSLESIINRAYSAGVAPQTNELMSQFARRAASGHSGAYNLLDMASAPDLTQTASFGRKLTQSETPQVPLLSRIRLGRRDRNQQQQGTSPAGQPAPAPALAHAEKPEPAPQPAAGKPVADSTPAVDVNKAEAGPPGPPANTAPPAVLGKSKATHSAETNAPTAPAAVPAFAAQPTASAKAAATKPAAQTPAAGKAAVTAPTAKVPSAPKPAVPKPVVPATAVPKTDSSKPAAPTFAASTPIVPQPAAPAKPAAPTTAAPQPAASKPATPTTAAPQPAAPATPAAPQPAASKAAVTAPLTTPEPAADSPPAAADDDADSSAPTAPAPAPEPTPGKPTGAAVPPAAATPDPGAEEHWHDMLAANNGYLPGPPAPPSTQGVSAQPWVAGAQYTTPFYGATGMSGFDEAPPVLRVTFMFGFSQNKTFPYGIGRVVSAPAGSVKYTIEAQNWPFCSLYNSLKMEVIMATTAKDAQPQFVLGDAAEVFQDMDSMRGPVTRRLQQIEAFTDFMDSDRLGGKKTAAGLGIGDLGSMDRLNVGPSKKVYTAKMLVGPDLAAATEFPTYAFSSNKFTSESNVTVALATHSKDAARFSLTFGYFDTSLFYDPSLFFTHKDDMMLAGHDTAPLLGAAACSKGEPECAKTRRRASTLANSSRGLSASASMHLMMSGAALLLVAALL